jgi:hypothetical protein
VFAVLSGVVSKMASRKKSEPMIANVHDRSLNTYNTNADQQFKFLIVRRRSLQSPLAAGYDAGDKNGEVYRKTQREGG